MKKNMKTLLGTSGPFLGTVRQKKRTYFFSDYRLVMTSTIPNTFFFCALPGSWFPSFRAFLNNTRCLDRHHLTWKKTLQRPEAFEVEKEKLKGNVISVVRHIRKDRGYNDDDDSLEEHLRLLFQTTFTKLLSHHKCNHNHHHNCNRKNNHNHNQRTDPPLVQYLPSKDHALNRVVQP